MGYDPKDLGNSPLYAYRQAKKKSQHDKRAARNNSKPAQGLTREAMAKSWIEAARKRRRETYNEPT